MKNASCSVSLARRYVAETIRDWGISQYEESATLLVSELTTNAYRHGEPPITLALTLTIDPPKQPPQLLIEVSDGARTQPVQRPPSDSGGGLGLTIINHLADITITTDRTGKTICALLKSAPDA